MEGVGKGPSWGKGPPEELGAAVLKKLNEVLGDEHSIPIIEMHKYFGGAVTEMLMDLGVITKS